MSGNGKAPRTWGKGLIKISLTYGEKKLLTYRIAKDGIKDTARSDEKQRKLSIVTLTAIRNQIDTLIQSLTDIGGAR